METKQEHSGKMVLIIGAAGLDVVGRLNSEPSNTTNPGHVHISSGGVARNVAENLARLGQPVQLISAIGDDSSGHFLLDELAHAGVGIDGCLISKTCPTGIYMASLLPNGSRYHALIDQQITREITPDYLASRKDLFQQADMLFFDANLSPESIRKIYQIARRYRVPVCADPTSTSLTCRLQPYLKDTSILTVNSSEAADLCAMDFDASQLDENITAGRKLHDLGVQTAIIQMGEYGVCYVSPETSGHIPAITTPVMDPTGAGDAFTGAMLYGILNDLSMDDSIQLGVSAASLTIRNSGSVVHTLNLEMLYDHLVI